MKQLPNQQCHATPDEVAELYKRSLTNYLMLNKIPDFNKKGDKLTGKFTACISPSFKSGKCAFIEEDGKCYLMKTGMALSGCQSVKDLTPKSLRQRSKDWITSQGEACIKFFAQMIKS